MDKPYSPACERNCEPILEVIEPLLRDSRSVLELGSGTGQHAVYFASRLPHLQWYTSDLEASHAGIRQWLDEAALDNVRYPILLDVRQMTWPEMKVDAVFSANTVHIMGWDAVRCFFPGAAGVLQSGGRLILYGPFNYNNQYTSESNARFDDWLKAQNPESSIRNFEDLNSLAEQAGFVSQRDHPMPANNRILVWEKIHSGQGENNE